MAEVTEEERDFLARVRGGKVLKCADRAQDRVRQRCRRAGWVVFQRHYAWGWEITESGRIALSDRGDGRG